MNAMAPRTLVLGAAALLLAALAATSAADSTFETPPTLRASELAPPALLKGPHHQVAEQAPVKTLLGRFSIASDFGTLRANGVEMLRLRVAEMAALATLEKTSKTQEFLKAAGTAAVRPIKAGAHMIANPRETVKGVSAGASRFFDRVSMGYQHITEGTSDAGKSDADKAQELGKRLGSSTVDVLGWEEERRALAKRLAVDPYTTNPILSEKLSDFAWVTFSGRVGLNTVVAVVVPVSTLLTATSITNDMIWDLKPADLIKANGDKLAALGAHEAHVKALLKNPWYSLTTLTWLVNGLEALHGSVGRADVVAFAATAADEDQARFIATAVTMLADVHKRTPIATVGAHGTVVGRTRGGAVVVVAPVDYIAWTSQVATFARRVDLQAPERTLVTTAKLSPRARKELAALGWTLHQAPSIAPPGVSLPTTSR